jgi:DNA polymerase
MSSDYQELLEAAIVYAQDLKAQGKRYVELSPEVLAELSMPVRVKSTQGNEVVQQQSAPVSKSIFDRARQPAATEPEKPKSFSPPSARPADQSPASNLSGRAPLPVAGNTTITAASTDKAKAIAELRNRAMLCMKCPHLASTRKTVVFGVGDFNAQLMFVGEAPGADEDAQGEPFVGAAGQLLTRIITTMGLSRATVYIANILKCRPDTPGQTSGNRKPTPEEMATCIPYLHEQIDLIQPKVLVALGGTAVEGLLHKTGISKLRGTWQTYRGIPLMPTYHPSYLLRNQALQEKRAVWEDMLQVMEKLSLPISEKQRAYFSKA